jgi:erythronate-4-phosphate dehydrogenase
MRIVADDKLPFLKGVLEPYADIEYLPGHLISKKHLKSADALLVRTRTRCDKDLLKDTAVSFIGTATIGFDHIDTSYCSDKGIVWKNAPGCNSSSVCQYVASALVQLSERNNFSLGDRALGVVGVGNAGTKIVQLAELLGMHVYLCDPPRVRNEGVCGFISLESILRECDLITFHVPLNFQGEDRTYHMIDHELISKLNKGTYLINTSRGEIADSRALIQAVNNNHVSGIVLDVWENEPDIDPGMLALTSVGTPHIAGYSADGKAKGTTIIIRELSRHFGLGIDDWEAGSLPEPLTHEIPIDCNDLSDEEVIGKAVLATYDVLEDDLRLRKTPHQFEELRETYPPRREFNAYTLVLNNAQKDLKRKCRKLGFKVI